MTKVNRKSPESFPIRKKKPFNEIFEEKGIQLSENWTRLLIGRPVTINGTQSKRERMHSKYVLRLVRHHDRLNNARILALVKNFFPKLGENKRRLFNSVDGGKEDDF